MFQISESNIIKITKNKRIKEGREVENISQADKQLCENYCVFYEVIKSVIEDLVS